MPSLILIRGAGDLASGVILRLQRVSLKVVVAELPQPLAVRRSVSFSEAVYIGQTTIEEVSARLVQTREEMMAAVAQKQVPVLVDPQAHILTDNPALFQVLVDGRMTKQPPDLGIGAASLVIGLGPGFVAGENCHAVVETKRGHYLGRVFWQGSSEPDTAKPEGDPRRVLRAPTSGTLSTRGEIGDHFERDQVVAEVDGQAVRAPFAGVLRGMLHPNTLVRQGLKIGDIDPRDDRRFCSLVSDKALAVGGGVLEAILSRADLRTKLWT
jgi:xanthine dehydrogenase accessory factor